MAERQRCSEWTRAHTMLTNKNEKNGHQFRDTMTYAQSEIILRPPILSIYRSQHHSVTPIVTFYCHAFDKLIQAGPGAFIHTNPHTHTHTRWITFGTFETFGRRENPNINKFIIWTDERMDLDESSVIWSHSQTTVNLYTRHVAVNWTQIYFISKIYCSDKNPILMSYLNRWLNALPYSRNVACAAVAAHQQHARQINKIVSHVFHRLIVIDCEVGKLAPIHWWRSHHVPPKKNSAARRA